MKNTINRLRTAADMIESWQAGPVPGIEKDSVLAILRETYETIKSDLRDNNQPAVCAAPLQNPVVETVQPDACNAPASAAPEPPTAVPPRDEVTEVVQYPVEVTEVPAAVTEPAIKESSLIVNSEDEKDEFRENILFDEGEVPVRPKLDRKALLSLYGDDPAPAAETVEAPTPVPATGGIHINVTDQAPVHTEAAPQPAAADSEPVQVLGDVLGSGSQTVSDIYAGNGQVADVASVVGSGRVDSLQRAIGINDKFLLIRNLFDGDARMYDSVMGTLEGFDSLEDALIYIHENFNWNPDNEAVKLLVDLLTRKLS